MKAGDYVDVEWSDELLDNWLYDHVRWEEDALITGIDIIHGIITLATSRGGVTINLSQLKYLKVK